MLHGLYVAWLGLRLAHISQGVMQSFPKKKAANWLLLAAFVMAYGGGAAPPVKPSELGSFLLPMAAAKNCGNLQLDWPSISARWGDPSKAAQPSSNPYSTLEPPSAFFSPLGFGAKTPLHGVPPTHSEGNPWTPNIWDKNNWQPVGASARPVLSAGAAKALARSS